MNVGRVVQVIGPTVDVAFDPDKLPKIYNAIVIEDTARGIKLTVEAALHVGDNVVRCIAMDSTDGLVRGMVVRNTGKPITMPVGAGTLGRRFHHRTRRWLLLLSRVEFLPGLSLRAGACARAAAGQYRGEGDGYPTTAAVRLPWMAAGGGLRVGGIWGNRLLWGVSGLLLIPIRRQTFSVDNAGVAYESAAVGGTLAVELGVRVF